ncbi:MAG: ATP-dependent protease, partial [Chloroflexi bacterium]|nr:ATP-dependent protease [Chloroflexota bacterium]
ESDDKVMAAHVQKAIDQREYRVSMTEDRLRQLIEDGTIHIATEGRKTGQVNGLAILMVGQHRFGKPSRITARVSLGRGQIVNVERETQMSGKLHNKGFMILTGYLNGKYGQNKPLSLSASIGFEQTYSDVDGDSASSTELYVLLSAISGLPIDQGIAVTGSVDQMGEVQAIGGATFKIEGFYDVCKDKGLTGSQGVMIPKDNVRNLVLKDEVVEAVRAGRFHIYAVSTIDEGIEVLTGFPAGELQEDGTYPEGTVHYHVEKRLEELAKKSRNYGKTPDETRENNDTPEQEA